MPTLGLVPNQHNMPLVEVTINKTKHQFLIDTGCSHSMFSNDLLDGMTVKPVGAAEAMGVGGSAIAFLMPVRFNFCGVSLSEISVSNQKAALPPGIAGLIGQDILQRFSVIEINNRERTIKLIP